MNLPNKLTLLRMVSIPFFVGIALAPQLPGRYFWATVIFAVASATDFLDGYIARKQGLVTDFGKLMDPLADKLLVASALIIFVKLEAAGAVPVIVIISREFLVTAVRTLAAQKGTVIAADMFGKFKTVAQIAWIITGFLNLHLLESGSFPPVFAAVSSALGWIAVVLTVLSGANYVIKNRELFRDR